MTEVKYPSVDEVQARLNIRCVVESWECEQVIRTAIDIYREQAEQPAPVDSIPWGDWPIGTHAAKDADGTCHLFNCEPQMIEHGWICQDANAPHGRWARCSFDDPYECIIAGPWRESLRKRPEGV